eukprot:6017397-Pyramimonas_sp.AAC.1
MHPPTRAIHPLTRAMHPLTRAIHPPTRTIRPLTRAIHPLTRAIHPLTRAIRPLTGGSQLGHQIPLGGRAAAPAARRRPDRLRPLLAFARQQSGSLRRQQECYKQARRPRPVSASA